VASKYDVWDSFFAELDGEEHVWTLDEFEEMTGVVLPPSARSHAPWWSNTTYSAKWARHGWYASPRLTEDSIRFGREPSKRGRPLRGKGSRPDPPSKQTPVAAVSRLPAGDARIILVGCVSQKADVPMAAKDLYVSDYWDKRRAYAEASGQPWFILSAKYGVLHPDQVIEPYDVSLNAASAVQRSDWIGQVGPQLIGIARGLGASTLEVHAGEAYTPPALVRLLNEAHIGVERPLAGMRIGEQKAWYLGRFPDSPVSVPAPPPVEPRPPADSLAIVDRLLEFGEESGSSAPEVAVFIPNNIDAEQYFRSNPFAFLTGVIFDQGIVAERAWEAPWLLKNRLGHFDLHRLAAETESVKTAVAEPPALHRYVNNVPEWVSAAARKVLAEYGGETAAIWSDSPTAAELQRRFEAFVGIGPKKAAMAVEILIGHFGVEVEDLSGTNLAYDVHVRRVFLRAGLADRDDQNHMIEMARHHNPDRPGALDGPAWTIGREWCHPSRPDCSACVLTAVCPRLIERGDVVKGA